MKFYNYPTVSSALSSGLILIYQSAKVNCITFANFLKNYYTKTEVDDLIEAVSGGILPQILNKEVLDDLSIEANSITEFPHSLETEDFVYDMFEWNVGQGKYIKMQFPLAEQSRSTTGLTLFSTVAINNFKIVLIG